MWIIFLTMILPVLGLFTIDDTWDRVVNKYVSAWTTECWQNSKHERVCRGDNNCKFLRNFVQKILSDGEKTNSINTPLRQLIMDWTITFRERFNNKILQKLRTF